MIEKGARWASLANGEIATRADEVVERAVLFRIGKGSARSVLIASDRCITKK